MCQDSDTSEVGLTHMYPGYERVKMEGHGLTWTDKEVVAPFGCVVGRSCSGRATRGLQE